VAPLVLVPSPLKAARASRRLCDAEGGILFGARVTTPAALTPLLLAAIGDARPILTPLAARLLAVESGDAVPRLGGFAPAGGTGRALAAAVAELRRGEVTAADARAAAGALAGRPGERLSAMAQVLGAYEARLASLGALDEAAARRAAAAAALAGRLEELELLVLDGFHALPQATLDLVVGLARRARRTVAHLPYFPERPDVCAPAGRLLAALEALHDPASRRDVTVALPSLEPPHRAPRIGRALQARSAGGGPAGAGGLVLAAAGPGEEGEAEAAASIVGRLLADGFAPEDVLLIAPSPLRAAPRLARAFTARGILLAASAGEPLSDLAPVRAALAALRAAVEPTRASLEAVAASAWIRLAPAPPRLEHWLDRAGALEGRGDPEEALRRRAGALSSPSASDERGSLLRCADALAAIRGALRMLAADARPREHAARLRAFLQLAGARRHAARAGPDLGRSELAALGGLEEAADDLAHALSMLGQGEGAMPARRWADLLEVALERPLRPAAEVAAGAVELWPLDEAAGLSARAAVVVGCARGAFPAPPRVDPLLREAERAAVNRAAGRAALAMSAARRAEAELAAFCALAAGRDALAVTWPADGPEGPGASPSPLALEVLCAAGITPPSAPSAPPDLGESRTPAEALRAAARAGREGRGRAAVEVLTAVSPELAARAASALARGALEAERRSAVLSRRASRGAGLVPPELSTLLARALPQEWSPSQLEAHARCPFRLFAGLVLRIEDPAAADLEIDPRDEGSLAHGVLEELLVRRRARGELPLVGSPAERDELREVAGELFLRFEREGRVGDPALWEARRGAVLARLERVIAAEGREAGGAVPALLEHRFGGTSGVPAITFGEGEEAVRVRGRVDRVDASPDRLVVIDYKDGRSAAALEEKLDREAVGETSFQLPIYLLAAARALPGRARLEATFLLLRSAERLEPFAAAPGDPLLALDAPSRAAARLAGVRPLADAVQGAVQAVRRGELPIASRDCGGCPFGALCRAQELAEVAA
jgi:hypothetical protein